jgi:molybdate transport system substrate-binding protein
MRIKSIALTLLAAALLVACANTAAPVHAPESTPGQMAATRASTAAICEPEIKVMISGGLTAAYLEVLPELERATGNTLVTYFGASMGTAPDSIPMRLERGEPADVLIMVGYALDRLIERGLVVAQSRVDLARSAIGMVVRAGAPKPDISSVEAFERTLLEAESIAYSASASGRYLSTELFPRLGIADRIAGKSKQILSERVGTVVARGEAEIGFQQISELLPIPGVDLVGPLPPELQKITVFSAGIPVDAKRPEAAREVIRFLMSSAGPAIAKSGMEPVHPGTPAR